LPTEPILLAVVAAETGEAALAALTPRIAATVSAQKVSAQKVLPRLMSSLHRLENSDPSES
jgi:hypothetical protein